MKDKNLQVFRDYFTKYQADFKGLGFESLERREQNLKLAEALGLPKPSQDQWKYSNFKGIVSDDLNMAKEAQSFDKVKSFLSQRPEVDHRVVFVNGRYSSEFSTTAQTKGIIEVYSSLGQPITDKPSSTEDVFEALNESLLTDGVTVEVNQPQSSKIEVLNISVSEVRSQVVTRLKVLVKSSCQGQLTEEFVNLGHRESVFNSVTELNLEPGAHFNYLCQQSASSEDYFLQSIKSKLARDSKLNLGLVHLGSKQSRSYLTTDLIEPGAEVKLSGASVLNESQHVDVFSDLRHLAEHTFSHQLFKGVLADKSKCIVTGRQYIKEDAQKVDSNQLCKNLVLSEKAEAISRPQLEVSADDVKAAHGAAIGQLNQDELFYLMSRAISKKQAFSLLTMGYALEVLEGHPCAGSLVKTAVVNKLNQLAKKDT